MLFRSLGVGSGMEFKIIVKGPDEKKAYNFLNKIFSSEKEIGVEED